MDQDPREAVGNGTEDIIAGLPQRLGKRKNVQIPTNFLGGTIESMGFIPHCLVFCVKVEVKIMLRVRGLLYRDLSRCLIKAFLKSV